MTEHPLQHYWADIILQDKERLKCHFTADATIKWHTSNEWFTLEEFLIANCDYPGNWRGTVSRIFETDKHVITITDIDSPDSQETFTVTSVFTFQGDKISELDEYWAENGPAPEWRQVLNLGRPIK